MKKLKTVYFGTPEFSVPCLELLSQHPHIEIVGVVTMPDRPAGRGKKLQAPAVATYAKENNLPLFQTENINREDEYLESIKNQNIDLCVVLAFAQFLGSKLLNLPRLGCFNIHTSLLPKYRGAAPIQYAILNGDTDTGVSIQKMVKKMDAGDLVHSRPVPIRADETGGELFEKLQNEAAYALKDFIENVIADKIKYEPQNEDDVSFAPTLKKSDGFLNFIDQTAEQIFNRTRAFSPWPGTYCFLGDKRLKVLKTEVQLRTDIKPGSLSLDMGSLVVGCKEAAVRLMEVQLEGKKACSDAELLNGLRNNPNFSYVINKEAKS